MSDTMRQETPYSYFILCLRESRVCIDRHHALRNNYLGLCESESVWIDAVQQNMPQLFHFRVMRVRESVMTDTMQQETSTALLVPRIKNL